MKIWEVDHNKYVTWQELQKTDKESKWTKVEINGYFLKYKKGDYTVVGTKHNVKY